MLFMKKYIIGAMMVMMAAVVAIPVGTQAQVTTAQSACTNITQTLNRGARNVRTQAQVAVLQRFLVSRGYLTVANPSEYGAFGLKTQDAVRKFQSDNGITSNGIVGPLTRAKILQSSCGGIINPSLTTLPDGCIPGAMFSYTTGLPCNTTATTTSPVSITSQMASSSIAIGNPSRAQTSFTFNISNLANNTIYIIKNPALAFGDYTTAASSSLATVFVSPFMVPGDTSAFYAVPALSTRTITVMGYMDNTVGATGVKEQMITGINYSDDTVNFKKFSIEKGLDGLKASVYLTGNGTACQTITQNLTVGSQGNDVIILQEYLLNNGYLAAITQKAYFDEYTRLAVAAWQRAVNISPADGYFGPISRVVLNEILCGAKPSISVTAPNGGETWPLETINNITWSTTGAKANTVTINLLPKVDTTCSFTTSPVLGSGFTQINRCPIYLLAQYTIAHEESNDGSFPWKVGMGMNGTKVPPGNYYVEIRDSNGNTDRSDGVVTIGATPTPTITVTSPNGGEMYKAGDWIAIRWNVMGSSTSLYDIHLAQKGGEYHSTIARGVYSANPQTQQYVWASPSSLVSYGTTAAFRVNVCVKDSEKMCDMSDWSFTMGPATSSPVNAVLVSNSTANAITTSDPQTAQATFSFTLSNTFNDDVYISRNIGTALAFSSTAATTSYSTFGGLGFLSGDTIDTYVLPAGSSRVFTVNALMFNSNGTTGIKETKITQIRYGMSPTALSANSITSGLEGLKVSVYLNGVSTTGGIATTTATSTLEFRPLNRQPLTISAIRNLLQKAQAANAVEAVKGFMNMLKALGN
jgi:peptidoglycan hydrolase-like protein with peptidoglycan-binding domain